MLVLSHCLGMICYAAVVAGTGTHANEIFPQTLKHRFDDMNLEHKVDVPAEKVELRVICVDN